MLQNSPYLSLGFVSNHDQLLKYKYTRYIDIRYTISFGTGHNGVKTYVAPTVVRNEVNP